MSDTKSTTPDTVSSSPPQQQQPAEQPPTETKKEENVKKDLTPHEIAEHAIKEKKVGWEHFEDYKDNFHERLSTFWPDERDQLHSGGVRETKRMVQSLQLDQPAAKTMHVMDLCCGEGATAVYLGKHYGFEVTGLEIVPKAVETAKTKAETEKVSDKIHFVCGTAFELPFKDSTFDHIYGQDPDAFSHPKRLVIFKECLRVLKPGGLLYLHHHWIPGFDFPADDLKTLETFNLSLGWKAIEDCSADTYVRDCKAAGFVIQRAEDLTDLASSHLRGVALKHMRATGKIDDKWLENTLSYIDRGFHFGVRIVAQKPSSKKQKKNEKSSDCLIS